MSKRHKEAKKVAKLAKEYKRTRGINKLTDTQSFTLTEFRECAKKRRYVIKT